MAYPDDIEVLDAAMDGDRTLYQEAHSARHNDAARVLNELQKHDLAATGAVARTLASKVSETVSVMDFGAVGNGVADDRAAFMAALAHLDGAGGGLLVVPAGTYLVSASISGTYNKIVMRGDAGQYASVIKSGGNFPPLVGSWEYSVISDITFDAADEGARGLHLYLNHTHLERVTVINWNTAGIDLNDGTYVAADLNDLGYLNRITECNVDSPVAGAGYGIYTTYRFTDSWIVGCNVGSTAANIRTEAGPLRIIGCHLNGNPEYNILMEGPNRVSILNNLMEGADKSSVYYVKPSFETGDAQHQVQIIGNAISNGGYDSPGTYPAIYIAGESATDKTFGVLIAGNLFAVEQALAGWSYAVHCKWADQITISGNSWATAHDNALPTYMELCGSAVSITGNGDDTSWKDWTPTWTNMTVGNGTVTAKYKVIDGTVHIRLKFQFGSTSSLTGSPFFSNPVTADSSGVFPIRLDGSVLDNDIGDELAIIATVGATDTNIQVVKVFGSYLDVAGQITSTVPFTWATGDRIYVYGSYPAA